MKSWLIKFSMICCCCGLVQSVYAFKNFNITLPPTAFIANREINESSALVRSARYPEVFWTLNDSGDSNRIFAITADGKDVSRKEGIYLEKAKNVDWESLVVDEQGALWVADVGNNLSDRKDLAVYRLEEPEPSVSVAKGVIRYGIRYEDQSIVPDPSLNYDCEALFVRKGKVYLLTKHWTTPTTRLYVCEDLKEESVNVARLIDEYPISGMVTAADYDHRRDLLAVLTYTGVRVFKLPAEGEIHLNNQIWRRDLLLGQAEGLAWAKDDQLLISNEKGELFHLNIPQEIFGEIK